MDIPRARPGVHRMPIAPLETASSGRIRALWWIIRAHGCGFIAAAEKRESSSRLGQARRCADFYSLRHTYIMNIGRLPISMKTDQELACYREPSLRTRHAHTQIDDKVKALDALLPTCPRTRLRPPR